MSHPIDGDLFDTIFKWALGVGGSVMGAITFSAGRKVQQHDREIGEIRVGQEALKETLTTVQGKVEKMDDKLDRILERLPRGNDR